jgi:hypothetical protein
VRIFGQDNTGPVIDCHAHLSFRPKPGEHPSDRLLIEAADSLGIDQAWVSSALAITFRNP